MQHLRLVGDCVMVLCIGSCSFSLSHSGDLGPLN